MYNLSGVFYRVWGVCGVMLLLGLICIFLEKPWSSSFRLANCKVGLIAIAVAICFGLFYLSRLFSPNISTYSGEFIESHRNSRVAPPLPVTHEYVFWNGEGKRRVFYLDVFSLKKIYPYEFEEGKSYTVYYDVILKIIVKIEAIE